MKKIIIDDEKSAVEYIKSVLNEWDAWKTHHKYLVQALEVLVNGRKADITTINTFDDATKLLDAEYERAKRLEYVNNPLAYALYQVWKKADTERNKK